MSHNAAEFLASLDQDWAKLVSAIGPYLPTPQASHDPFEALIRAVAYQQLHGKAAAAILQRLLLQFDGQFPSAAALLAIDPELLRSCGFSRRKAATILGLAQAQLDGIIPAREQALLMEDKQLITSLSSLPGIGPWSVEMLLMHNLGRPDILPVTDFGVRDGYRRLKGWTQMPSPRELQQLGLAWSPHRSAAAWYLWRVPRQATGDESRD
ncbi:DNA-3-methyladenine glycosylase family protein [Methylobacillus glycogenes]|uniref:DNA-3-methyladenine glycosylase family protein n=1 Tax=Methylobacillus glycogenes TaxID=406 RepID=UPI000471768C|nr:DNA-3-methyladenine glycosylase [Methylobacillus glycogenes]